MSDSAGYVLALGNCDETYSGPYLGYWHFDCTYQPGPGVSRTRGDVEAREQATRYMRDHQRRLPVVAAARVGRLWHVYRVEQGIDFDVFYERRERIAVDPRRPRALRRGRSVVGRGLGPSPRPEQRRPVRLGGRQRDRLRGARVRRDPLPHRGRRRRRPVRRHRCRLAAQAGASAIDGRPGHLMSTTSPAWSLASTPVSGSSNTTSAPSTRPALPSRPKGSPTNT